MIVYISKNNWNNPISALFLEQQRRKLLRLAKQYKGFRGLKTKWSLGGSYFMTLWKSEEELDNFLASSEVKSLFNERINHIEVNQIRMASINFIPWREVQALMKRNSTKIESSELLGKK